MPLQNKNSLGEVFRFLVVGGLSTAIHFVTLVIQIEVFNLAYASVANVLASIISMIFAYGANKYFVFGKQGATLKAPILKFMVTYGLIFLIHFTIPLIFTDILGRAYLLSFCLALALHVPMSFLLNKYWVFHEA